MACQRADLTDRAGDFVEAGARHVHDGDVQRVEAALKVGIGQDGFQHVCGAGREERLKIGRCETACDRYAGHRFGWVIAGIGASDEQVAGTHGEDTLRQVGSCGDETHAGGVRLRRLSGAAGEKENCRASNTRKAVETACGAAPPAM